MALNLCFTLVPPFSYVTFSFCALPRRIARVKPRDATNSAQVLQMSTQDLDRTAERASAAKPQQQALARPRGSVRRHGSENSPVRPPRVVVVSGNDGTGKSTLSAALATSLGATYLPEPFEQNLFGKQYLADPRRWTYHAEVEFVVQRALALRQADNHGRTIVADRCMAEDVEVFARLWAERGVLSQQELASLRNVIDALTTSTPAVTHIVYLRCELDVIMDRLGRRSQVPEDGDLRKLTARRGELYEEWIASQTVPIIRLDTTSARLSDLARIAEGVASDLRSLEGGQLGL